MTDDPCGSPWAEALPRLHEASKGAWQQEAQRRHPKAQRCHLACRGSLQQSNQQHRSQKRLLRMPQKSMKHHWPHQAQPKHPQSQRHLSSKAQLLHPPARHDASAAAQLLRSCRLCFSQESFHANLHKLQASIVRQRAGVNESEGRASIESVR